MSLLVGFLWAAYKLKCHDHNQAHYRAEVWHARSVEWKDQYLKELSR